MPSLWFRPPIPRCGTPFAPRGPGGPVPPLHGYYEVLRLPVARLAALRFLRLAIPPVRPLFVPDSPGRGAVDRPGVGHPALPSGFKEWRRQGLPSSRGTLVIIRPVLRPRRDRACSMGPGVRCPTRPPRLTKARARREEISGLNRTAFDLAVYASQGRSPATTQDSLPAAGPALPDGIGYPQGPCKRFQAVLSSFSELLGARSDFVFRTWGQTLGRGVRLCF